MLKNVDAKLTAKKIQLEIPKETRKFLVEKGFDANYGARPLLRTLQKLLEDPLAEDILVKSYGAGTKLKVTVDKKEDKLIFTKL